MRFLDKIHMRKAIYIILAAMAVSCSATKDIYLANSHRGEIYVTDSKKYSVVSSDNQSILVNMKTGQSWILVDCEKGSEYKCWRPISHNREFKRPDLPND